MITIDAPAYVQHADHFQNGVSVKGGNNYDLSRGGVATPVVLLREPPPVAQPPAVISPQQALLARWGVTADSSMVALKLVGRGMSQEDQAWMRQLPSGVSLVLVAWSDGSAKADRAASAQLKAVLRGIPKGVSLRKAAVISRDSSSKEPPLVAYVVR